MAKKTAKKSNLKSNKEYFNCGRKGHYTQHCRSSTCNSIKKKLVEKSTLEAKQNQWKKNQAKAAKLTSNNNDHDIEPYLAGPAVMTHKVDEEGERYLDSYTLRLICNNYKIFVNLNAKNYKFVMASGNIIRSKQVRTVMLPLENDILTLSNIIYPPKYDFKLIFLGKL